MNISIDNPLYRQINSLLLYNFFAETNNNLDLRKKFCLKSIRDFIKNTNDNVVSIQLDAKFSYHHNFYKERIEILNLDLKLHLKLIQFYNDETTLYFSNQKHDNLFFIDEDGRLFSNSLFDISLNDFRFIPLEEYDKKIILNYKKIPLVKPKLFSYSSVLVNENDVLMINNNNSEEQCIYPLSKLKEMNMLSFYENKIVINQFNDFMTQQTLIYNHEITPIYYFKFLTSNFFQQWYSSSYGKYALLDHETLSKIAIPLYPYNAQLFLKDSINYPFNNVNDYFYSFYA